MIPAPFDYHRPDTVEAAVKLIADLGDSARVIAGGHSLIPLMKMRMTDIAHLVDLQKIGALKGIAIDGGTVTIGAMTTQHELIGSAALGSAAPIIREAALQIADPQVRYVGTIGGNVANGDPGNDMPGVMQCLDATYHLRGPDGERTVKARDFYEAAYFTARADDEILTAVSFEVPVGGQAYVKQKRKTGDYATAAAAVIIAKSGGNCSAASIAMTNLSDTPVWCEAAGDALVGSSLGAADIDNAVDAMQAVINPQDDNKGPAAFKRHAAAVILRRAIERATSRA
ncbi:FAD binding domain-containing protein [Mycoplana rhizolycopersici]|uniref:Xanthine dehydrogenase family protein subunit M n=1 Tax=Mycoplana rhizolycopersici TaxID=2746702 RepID=A0ABX2QDX7_9HYPH|nr:xanthine dehydrogenase family protein subunit M [Rhizobium rhizolycopersici]NVP55378.1 xanthine dehydrogenase family protein subunit M [Rhizobium rhizolycopersici]